MSKIVVENYPFDCVEVFGLTLKSIQNSQSVENNGFEPLTPCLQSRCSSQLS